MTEFPNCATQFKPGQSGNPGGKTKKHRQAEVAAAELAANISLELVTAVSDAIENADNSTKQEQIRGDVLKLLKDVQDRAHGTPKQTIEQDNTHSMAPKGLDEFYSPQTGGHTGESGS